MIVGGQTKARAQLSSTIIDYHEPFDQGVTPFRKFLSLLSLFSCDDEMPQGLAGQMCSKKVNGV